MFWYFFLQIFERFWLSLSLQFFVSNLLYPCCSPVTSGPSFWLCFTSICWCTFFRWQFISSRLSNFFFSHRRGIITVTFFREQPLFLTWCCVALISSCKAYPVDSVRFLHASAFVSKCRLFFKIVSIQVIGDTAFTLVFFACNFPLIQQTGLKPNFFLYYLFLNTCCCIFTFW